MRTTYRNLAIGWLAAAVLSLSLAGAYHEHGGGAHSHDYPALTSEVSEKTGVDPEDLYPLRISEETGRSMIPVWSTVQW